MLEINKLPVTKTKTDNTSGKVYYDAIQQMWATTMLKILTVGCTEQEIKFIK